MRDFRQAFRMMREVYKVANILVCDDDKDIVEAISIYLEQEGYTVLKAYDGVEAINALRSQSVDLLIIDIMMPKLDGIRATLKIREENPLPIIILSAKSEDADKILGLNVGADDYVTKPFNPLELVARVKAHLARYERLIGSHVEENKLIEIRGLKIDTTARRVWVNGKEKAFTTKEFDLLTFLASHPNHVYTKDELFSEIWDMESIGDIATVTVHIKKIREKIEYDTSKPQYIETIWGVGYRFKV